jgi:nucleotide-binding universal stress UspA family protein
MPMRRGESVSQRAGESTGPANERGYIVVGVDGSGCSKDALRWAARQAELTGAAVDAVMAWHFPAFYGWAPADSEDLDFLRFAQQALADAVDEVFGPDHPDWLRTRVAEGNAAHVLVEASADAELLVVGSRGHEGFTGLLLGSVSTYCIHHARCPVTVIRPRR